MDNKKQEVIEFSKRLNSTNLSPLRSGNISVRTQIDGEDGFYITPSGIKYENLKEEDIVFLSNEKEYDFLKIFNSGLNPSSEWRFHQERRPLCSHVGCGARRGVSQDHSGRRDGGLPAPDARLAPDEDVPAPCRPQVGP